MPVVDVFYDWYENLPVDQRVRHMPYFVPERLDLVQTGMAEKPPQTTSNPVKTDTLDARSLPSSNSPEVTPRRKPASFDSETESVSPDAAADLEPRSPSPPPPFSPSDDACDWDEFDRMVRWARVLSNRRPEKKLRKEVLIKGWQDSILNMNLSQWYVLFLAALRVLLNAISSREHQVKLCTKIRDARLLYEEQCWNSQFIIFEGQRYEASLFPISWRKYCGTTALAGSPAELSPPNLRPGAPAL
jgi:hypothetical protein